MWEMHFRRSMWREAADTTRYARLVVRHNSAAAQAKYHDLLASRGLLQGDEPAVMKWAANSNTISAPSSSNSLEYKKASAVEALTAYLYLTDMQRLNAFFDSIMSLSVEALGPESPPASRLGSRQGGNNKRQPRSSSPPPSP